MLVNGTDGPGDAFHGKIVFSEQHDSGWDVTDLLKCYIEHLPALLSTITCLGF